MTRASTGFVTPDFSARVDIEAQKKLIQPGATVKGHQFRALVEECARHKVSAARSDYSVLRSYPGAEFLDLLVFTAARCWPHVPVREGLRQVGRRAYAALYDSLAGRAVFAIVGNNSRNLWKVFATGYAMSGSTGTATPLELRENEALIRLDGYYSFLDSWHVGIIEGAFAFHGAIPNVKVKMLSPTSAEFWVQWRDRSLRPSRPPR